MAQPGDKLEIFSLQCFACRISIRFVTAKRRLRCRINQRRSRPSNSWYWEQRSGCNVALRFPVRLACFSIASRLSCHRQMGECDFITKCSAALTGPYSSAYSITHILSRADLCTRKGRAREGNHIKEQ